MNGPLSLGSHGEGTVFAIPLPGPEYLVGIVIRRRHPKTIRIGMMREPVSELPASPEVVTRSSLSVLTQVQASALDSEVWPVVGVIKGFVATDWPDPPMLPGDKIDQAQTAEVFQRDMISLVRRRRRKALEDRTWVAEHPELADPIVGTRYMELPPERIRDHVEERLSHNGSLAEVVLRRVDLSEGTFISTLPQEVGVDQAVTYPEAGGKVDDRGRRLIRGHMVLADGTREPVHAHDLSCLTMLSEWLLDPAHVVIHRAFFGRADSEERLLRWREWFRNAGGNLLSYGDEVYGVIPSGAADKDVTESFLHELDWSKLGFLSRSTGELMDRTELSEADLHELADELEAIIIGAYDGEGYIVWTRTHGDDWLVG